MTGLTEASVSTTVRQLLEDGLVVESGQTRTAGKPRTLLELDPGARFAVGVHLDASTMTCVLTGQTGGVVSRLARPIPPGAGTSQLVEVLLADVELLISSSGIDRARCLGLGLVASGPREGLKRSSLTPAHVRWNVQQLQAHLARATTWPVLVENDATAAAVGEYWVAKVKAERSFAALYMGDGIGAGIIIDGSPYRGLHAGAGEFGHVCLDVDGPQCWCGSRGCLEALAGPQTVVARAMADPLARGEVHLEAEDPRRTVTSDFSAVARAARAGGDRCRALLEDSARYVAAAAESVSNLLDIDLLVLTGPGFAAAAFVYGPAISARMAPASTRTWRRRVTVTVSSAAATASATGAAALLLQTRLQR